MPYQRLERPELMAAPMEIDSEEEPKIPSMAEARLKFDVPDQGAPPKKVSKVELKPKGQPKPQPKPVPEFIPKKVVPPVQKPAPPKPEPKPKKKKSPSPRWIPACLLKFGLVNAFQCTDILPAHDR